MSLDIRATNSEEIVRYAGVLADLILTALDVWEWVNHLFHFIDGG